MERITHSPKHKLHVVYKDEKLTIENMPPRDCVFKIDCSNHFFSWVADSVVEDLRDAQCSNCSLLDKGCSGVEVIMGERLMPPNRLVAAQIDSLADDCEIIKNSK